MSETCSLGDVGKIEEIPHFDDHDVDRIESADGK